ncbi:hypothetical protein BDW22DRAFT_1358335 [Trametopsis cervina]|nr:hypothetical protein BDW22DRAFT_1358335 [Trametopsis cervina]
MKCTVDTIVPNFDRNPASPLWSTRDRVLQHVFLSSCPGQHWILPILSVAFTRKDDQEQGARESLPQVRFAPKRSHTVSFAGTIPRVASSPAGHTTLPYLRLNLQYARPAQDSKDTGGGLQLGCMTGLPRECPLPAYPKDVPRAGSSAAITPPRRRNVAGPWWIMWQYFHSVDGHGYEVGG